jgi:hypothetical protein
MTEINPNRIVPKGPIIDFDELHDRERLALFCHSGQRKIEGNF